MIKKLNSKIAEMFGVAARFLYLLPVIFLLCAGARQASADPTPTPTPVLKLDGKYSGADETEGVKITTPLYKFEREFWILLEQGAEITDLTVFVAPLTAPDGKQTEVNWMLNDQSDKNAKATVSVSSHARLKMLAELPTEGAYTGFISLIYNNKRYSIPITLSRTRPALTLEIPDPQAVFNETTLTEDIPIQITIKENGGRRLTINPIQLDQLLSTRPNEPKFQAHFDRLSVSDESGKILNQPFTIEPYETKSLRLIISGLSEPGQFSGKINISSPDAALLTEDVAIYKRRGWILATFLIALGVFSSFLIQFYVKSARPRLLLQHRLGVAANELEDVARTAGNELSDDENKVLQTLRRRLSSTYEELETRTAEQVNEVIAEVARKLYIFPKWVNARRAVESLDPPSLQDDFRPKLPAALLFMENDRLVETEAAAIETDLDAVPAGVIAAAKKDLTGRLSGFRAEVNEKIVNSAETTRQKLNDEVLPKITQAESALTGNDLKSAQKHYGDSRLAYIRISADDLIERLPASAPHGFNDDNWNELKNSTIEKLSRVREAADAATAATAYQAAYTFYLRELAVKLRDRARFYRAEVIEKHPGLSPEDKNKLTGLITESLSAIEGALQKISSGQLDEAANDYLSATAKFEEVHNALQPGGGDTMSAVSADVLASAAALGGVSTDFFELPFWQSIFPREKLSLNTAASTARRISRLDVAFAFVILLIAVLLGLKVLWSDNLTWGGIGDYFIAVFWGLGLHQVTSATAFEGFTALASRFSK